MQYNWLAVPLNKRKTKWELYLKIGEDYFPVEGFSGDMKAIKKVIKGNLILEDN